jgi:undecaprenyl-diphosphatase
MPRWFPGFSSGASIVGGMSQKTNSAMNFHFLAVRLCLAAKKMLRLLQDGFVLTHDQINLLIIGNVIAFIVALLAIKSFIGFFE